MEIAGGNNILTYMILMVLKYYISKLEVGASDPVLFLLMKGGGGPNLTRMLYFIKLKKLKKLK